MCSLDSGKRKGRRPFQVCKGGVSALWSSQWVVWARRDREETATRKQQTSAGISQAYVSVDVGVMVRCQMGLSQMLAGPRQCPLSTLCKLGHFPIPSLCFPAICFYMLLVTPTEGLNWLPSLSQQCQRRYRESSLPGFPQELPKGSVVETRIQGNQTIVLLLLPTWLCWLLQWGLPYQVTWI